MPPDTPGDDADPGRDVEPDATGPTAEVDSGADPGVDPHATEPAPSLDPTAEPGAPHLTPDVDAGAEEEITEPIPIVGGEDTAESPAGPMVVGAPPPIDYGTGAEPVDRAGRNRRRALVAALVAAILALLGLGAFLL